MGDVIDNIIDYDVHGHCVVCHKNMIVETVVGDKVIKRFLPEYDETTYMLDDGSKMRVATCRDCKHDLLNDDTDKKRVNIMDTVKRGWKRETDSLVSNKDSKWDKEKANKHMKEYNKKSIITLLDNKTEQQAIQELRKFKKEKTHGSSR